MFVCIYVVYVRLCANVCASGCESSMCDVYIRISKQTVKHCKYICNIRNEIHRTKPPSDPIKPTEKRDEHRTVNEKSKKM